MAMYRFSHKENTFEEAKHALKMVKEGSERLCDLFDQMKEEFGIDERRYSRDGYDRRDYDRRDWDRRDWDPRDMDERRMRDSRGRYM